PTFRLRLLGFFGELGFFGDLDDLAISGTPPSRRSAG
ncbi:MAG: hypothetical protein QOJ68_2690, partial [Blastococcus sp.]|nr:hypothetical protein [Blastococcus sp.]